MISKTGTLLAWLCLHVAATPENDRVETAALHPMSNGPHVADKPNLSGLASIFSPRMDFDQWKPLIGRGDPLRNDPTYDYEPPVLERVRYWLDDSRIEREQRPEKKYEVLMLGVSSRKPSAPPRPPPPRRHHRPQQKYEDFTYRISDYYPMTILVPPPPPPPGHKPSLYLLNEKPTTPPFKTTEPPTNVKHTLTTPDHLTSLYALQESNLIYQSSTTNQNWLYNVNETQDKPHVPEDPVNSDYAGWGPATFDDTEADNYTSNLILSEHGDFSKQPYSFYKPMLSEAPPPPQVTTNPLLLPTFVPTALPPLPSTTTPAITVTVTASQTTYAPEPTTTEITTFTFGDDEETTTDKYVYNTIQTTPTVYKQPTTPTKSILDMISPMLTMPLVNGPDRPEDNLYAHASENLHVYKEHTAEDKLKLETMQTMQPPPPIPKQTETTSTSNKPLFHVNTIGLSDSLNKMPTVPIRDPYFHMRFTSPIPTVESSVDFSKETKSTTENPAPTYLIIQGHSKVKTYSSKQKPVEDKHTSDNEITKPNETTEVRHLHPIKEKYSSQKTEKGEIRKGKAQSLKSLVEQGRGSIEIQETDLGIKYDVSDGSDVPVEIYRKGIVDNDENAYSKNNIVKRTRRQTIPVSIYEILPVDENKLERYVYNYLKEKKNSTGITGLVAKVVTGSVGSLLDGISEDDDDDDEDEEDEDERR